MGNRNEVVTLEINAMRRTLEHVHGAIDDLLGQDDVDEIYSSAEIKDLENFTVSLSKATSLKR